MNYMLSLLFAWLGLNDWLNNREKKRIDEQKDWRRLEQERINSQNYPPSNIPMDPKIANNTIPVSFDMVHNQNQGLKEGDYVTPILQCTAIRGKVTVVPGQYYRVVANKKYNPFSSDVWDSCAYFIRIENINDSIHFDVGKRPGYGYNWRKVIL